MKSFLIAESIRGIGAARYIAETYGDTIVGLATADLIVLRYGAGHSFYEESSKMLLDTGVFIEFNEELYHIDITESGDWFAVHPNEFSRFYSEEEELEELEKLEKLENLD